MQSKDITMLFSLQLFADGASGGDGGDGGAASATGESSGDAGQAHSTARTLEDLGVPRDRAEKYRARKARQGEAMPQDESGASSQGDDPSQALREDGPSQALRASSPRRGEPSEQPSGQDAVATAFDWDKAIKDPAFNRKLQETITARTKNLRDAMKDLAPALEVIGRQYGLDLSDMSKADYKALAKAVTEDDRYYEDRALEMGVDVSTVKKIDSLEADKRRRDAEERQRQQDEQVRSHYAQLQQQAAELKRDFPDFNLDAELNNPAFFRMTSPGGGLSVKQAFYAIHADEITAAKQAQTARAVTTAISNSIRAGRSMPQENGTRSRVSSGVTDKLYSQMSRTERAQYKADLMSGKRKF